MTWVTVTPIVSLIIVNNALVGYQVGCQVNH